MSVDQEELPETHLTVDGLYIPPAFQEFTAQVVFRTPRATIQHFSPHGELDLHYGMIDESHFGDPEEMLDAMNPDLAPNRVSIKPQGEDAVTLRVTGLGEPEGDGGLDG